MTDYPQLPALPPAPQRNMSEDEFASASDAFVAALPGWGNSANDMAAYFNAAAQSAQGALAAANYLGPWAQQVGSVSPPASVDHLGVLYFLVAAVDDITQYEPGVADRWRPMIANQEGVAIGQAILTAKGLPLGDYLRMDGNIYPRDTYETLYQLLPAAQLTNYQDVIAGTPSLHSAVRSVDYSPDGSYLAATHWSSSPYLTITNTADWSVVSGIPALPDDGDSVAFSPDGAYLAVGHKGYPYLTIINTADWSVVSGTPALSGRVYGVAFSPDGAYLALAHQSGSFLTIINTADWSVVGGTPTLSGTGNGVAFSPGGTYLAVAHQSSPCLTVIDTNDWSVVSGTPSFSSKMECAAFSPSGAYLAVGGGYPYLTIIDTSDWSVVSGTPVFGSDQRDIAFSPDGAYLVAAGAGFTLIDTMDWSVVSGTPDTGNTLSARFSPYGDYLAIGHLDAPYLSVITGSDSETEFRMPLIESNDESLEWRIKAV